MTAIPLIDIGSLLDGSNPDGVGIEMTRAGEQTGFF